MRIRTILLAASIAALPALAIAQSAVAPTDQTAPPAAAGPGATSPDVSPGTRHHDPAARQQRRAALHQKYQQLSEADKAKFKELTQQIRQLRRQQMQLLGISKS